MEQNSFESDEPSLNVKLQFIQVLTNFERGEQVGLISELSLEAVWISTKGLTRDILVEVWNEGNKEIMWLWLAVRSARFTPRDRRQQCSAGEDVRYIFMRYSRTIDIYTDPIKLVLVENKESGTSAHLLNSYFSYQ